MGVGLICSSETRKKALTMLAEHLSLWLHDTSNASLTALSSIEVNHVGRDTKGNFKMSTI